MGKVYNKNDNFPLLLTIIKMYNKSDNFPLNFNAFIIRLVFKASQACIDIYNIVKKHFIYMHNALINTLHYYHKKQFIFINNDIYNSSRLVFIFIIL